MYFNCGVFEYFPCLFGRRHGLQLAQKRLIIVYILVTMEKENKEANGKPKGKPRGLRRDRDCFKCKERQVKCDLNRPECTPCLEANIFCTGYPSRIIWSNEYPAEGKPTSSKISKSHFIRGVGNAAVAATNQFIPDIGQTFRSSIDSLSGNSVSPELQKSTPITPLSPDSNDVILPQKTTNFYWGVRAILTAFKHVSQYNKLLIFSDDGAEEEFKRTQQRYHVLGEIWKFVTTYIDSNSYTDAEFDYHTLQLRAAAIEELKHFVNEGSVESIFAILAFTYFDVSQESFGIWHRHLQGARSLPDVHCSNLTELYKLFKELPGLDHAITLFNWWDVMGALIMDNRRLIFDSWHRQVADECFFKLVGCPRDAFLLFAEILHKRDDENTNDDVDNDDCFIRALNIVLSISNGIFTYEQQVSNAWKYACLLKASSSQLNANSPVLPEFKDILVRKICDVLAVIPSDSLLSLHMAVCVYIAAMNASEQDCRDQIIKYWQHWNSDKFPIYRDALELCQSKWNNEKNGIL